MSQIDRKMFFVAAILIISGVTKAEIYKVGHVDYKSWAASKHFHVGDIILFEYNKEFHNVVRVTHKNYQTCNATAPYGIWTSGNDEFKISKPGHYFYISSFPNHCEGGQKVDIRVPVTPALAPKVSPQQSPTPFSGAAPKADSPRAPAPVGGIPPKASSPQSPTPASGVAPKASPRPSPTPASGVAAPKTSPRPSPTPAISIAPKASPQQSPTPASGFAPKAPSPQSSPPSSVAPNAAPVQSPPSPTHDASISPTMPLVQPLAPTHSPYPKSSATRSWTKNYSLLVAACVSIFWF